jgi:hypothetical protein
MAWFGPDLPARQRVWHVFPSCRWLSWKAIIALSADNNQYEAVCRFFRSSPGEPLGVPVLLLAGAAAGIGMRSLLLELGSGDLKLHFSRVDLYLPFRCGKNSDAGQLTDVFHHPE